MRARRGVLLGAAALAVTVSGAYALGPGAAGSPSLVKLFAGALQLGSRSADSDAAIRFDISSSTYTVTDRAGVTASGRCTQVDQRTASCSEGHPASLISWVGGNGDDRLLVRAPVPGRVLADAGDGDDVVRLENGSSARAVLSGRYGSDTLVGGSVGDSITGHEDTDKIVGRGGDDVLTGGNKADRLLGGGGDDEINATARGLDRDRVIDCGPGQDLVAVDRGVDPQPRRCERMVRR